MLSTAGMISAITAYGPISGKGVEIAGKRFAIGAAALTAAALLIAYGSAAGLKTVNLMSPAVIAALFAGAMLPVLLAAVAVNSTGKTAWKKVAAPGLPGVLLPLAMGFFMGQGALIGLLVGSLVSGTLTAVVLTSMGAGRNSADQSNPGMPFGDAAVSSAIAFMKLAAITAVVSAPLFL